MSEAKVYPRIWSWHVERKIIGETKLLWLVEPLFYGWKWPVKVSKKFPNKFCGRHSPVWFFSEAERAEEKFKHLHGVRIKKFLSAAPLTADQLRQIAAIIGYEVAP